eukprot:s1533_g3.t1
MVSIQLAAGCLVFRLTDGFARNALLANQIQLFQALCGFGSNSAQRAAKFLSAACSVAPLLLGAAQRIYGMRLSMLVLVGCFVEALCTAFTALTGAAPDWAQAVTPTLKSHEMAVIATILGFYALGYGAVTSAMPALTRKSAPDGSLCTGLMQAFVAVLTAGAIFGISAAALAQSFHQDHLALLTAVLALSLGICFLPPLGGTPAPWARRILRCAVGVRPEELATWEASDSRDSGHRLLAPRDARDGRDANGSEALAPLAPVLWRLVLLLPFYAAAIQWTTSWYVQTLYLDRNVAGFEIPACLLQAFERLMSLAALTLLRATSVLKWKTSTRLSLGSLLAACAMFVSATVEYWRKSRLNATYWPGEEQISTLSILWLLPQFALIAAAEAFIYPASAEFLSLSALAYGLGCAVQASAVAALGLLLGHLKDWIPETSPNEGHYDKFYFCLGTACLGATLLFFAFPFSASVSA